MWTQVEDALHQSATRVLTGAATLLPGVIAFVVAVLIATMLGWALGVLVRHALRSADFDRRMTAWGWSELAGRTGPVSPTLLAARLATWLVILVGLLIGLAAFDPTLTSRLMLGLFGSAMNLLTAMVILILGGIAAQFLSRSVLINLVNMNVPTARLLSVGVKWLVLVMTAAMALDHLSIGGQIVNLAFGILFGGIVLTLSLAVGLRSKELAHWSLTQQSDRQRDEGGEPFEHL